MAKDPVFDGLGEASRMLHAKLWYSMPGVRRRRAELLHADRALLYGLMTHYTSQGLEKIAREGVFTDRLGELERDFPDPRMPSAYDVRACKQRSMERAPGKQPSPFHIDNLVATLQDDYDATLPIPPHYPEHEVQEAAQITLGIFRLCQDEQYRHHEEQRAMRQRFGDALTRLRQTREGISNRTGRDTDNIIYLSPR